MIFDIRQPILLIPESFGRALSAKPSNKVLRVAADLLGKLHHIHSSKNYVVGLHWIRGIKWRTIGEIRIENATVNEFVHFSGPKS